jgi:hypothetical protein
MKRFWMLKQMQITAQNKNKNQSHYTSQDILPHGCLLMLLSIGMLQWSIMKQYNVWIGLSIRCFRDDLHLDKQQPAPRLSLIITTPDDNGRASETWHTNSTFTQLEHLRWLHCIRCLWNLQILRYHVLLNFCPRLTQQIIWLPSAADGEISRM